MPEATNWRPDGWGERARIGLLTPHMDVVPEGEFNAIAPPGVSVHAARVPLGWSSGSEPAPIGLEAVRSFAEPPEVDRAVALLAAAPLDVIAYGFTSSSYLLGADGDLALEKRLEEEAGGIPVVIPCRAVLRALQVLGARRLAVVNPPWFPVELTEKGCAYFRDAGIEVALGNSVSSSIPAQTSVRPEFVYAWVHGRVPDTVDSVFVGGWWTACDRGRGGTRGVSRSPRPDGQPGSLLAGIAPGGHRRRSRRLRNDIHSGVAQLSSGG